MSITFEDVTFDYAARSASSKKRSSGTDERKKDSGARRQSAGSANAGAANGGTQASSQEAASACPPALDHVSLEIPDGMFLGIIGHTGSGKSTLIQHMNGILQPTSGRVLVDGLDLADRKNRRIVRKRVGIAFQYPEYQLFAPTVREDVAFGPRNLGLSDEEVDERVHVALERVGLSYDGFADRSPFHLSGGQQRRVALAGILAMEPKTLVLDEPMAGLDPQGREDTLALVHRLYREGLTVVMVSHSMEDVAENAERVLVMNHGRVFLQGTPDEVFAHSEELYRIGLNVPHATLFADRMARTHGIDLPSGIHRLDDLADALAKRIGPRTKEEYLALKQADGREHAQAGGQAGGQQHEQAGAQADEQQPGEGGQTGGQQPGETGRGRGER
jgi:energy-coupling factor transport system ATP-binding protein